MRKKIIIWSTLLILMIPLFYFVRTSFFISQALVPECILFAYPIKNYIVVNKFNFPQSETEMVKNGFLQKEIRDGFIVYMTPFGIINDFNDITPTTRMCQYSGFNFFKLSYGINLEDMEEVSGTLYDKKTKKEVLLISGPYPKLMNKFYQSFSVQVFRYVMNEKSKRSKSTEKNNP